MPISFCLLIQFHLCLIQAQDDIDHAHLSDVPPYCASNVELLVDVDFHDVQRLALPSSSGWCSNWLLFVWVEEIRYCWYYRALSLIVQRAVLLRKDIYRNVVINKLYYTVGENRLYTPFFSNYFDILLSNRYILSNNEMEF